MVETLLEQEIIDSFGTKAFISLIFQAVCLVAYLICANTIQEKELNSQGAGAAETSKENEKEDTASKEKALHGIIKAELTLVKILKEYKVLYDGAILSTADYIDKKVKILQYSEKRIQSVAPSILNKCSFEGIAQAEVSVIELLKQYKVLLDEGVISEADFVQKKVSLLSYIIK